MFSAGDHRMRRKYSIDKRRGFTMIEVLLGTVIVSFIALISISVLNSIITGRNKIEKNQDAASELRFVSRMLKNDLQNLYRDSEKKNVKFLGTSMGVSSSVTSLTFYCVNRQKARSAYPESDFYEVEYMLSSKDDKFKLLRRLWPAPDPEREDAGGVVMPFAESIVDFSIRYLDNFHEWHNEWDWKKQSLPTMVEVNLVASELDSEEVLVNSFYVAFPRWPTREQMKAEGGKI